MQRGVLPHDHGMALSGVAGCARQKEGCTLCCVLSSCPLGVRLRADKKLKTEELLRSLGGLFRVGNVRLGTLHIAVKVYNPDKRVTWSASKLHCDDYGCALKQ